MLIFIPGDTVNLSKTEEIIIDFRSHSSVISHVGIDDQVVESETQYNYLGILIKDKLSFE